MQAQRQIYRTSPERGGLGRAVRAGAGLECVRVYHATVRASVGARGSACVCPDGTCVAVVPGFRKVCASGVCSFARACPHAASGAPCFAGF